jgi:hypothetical protein
MPTPCRAEARHVLNSGYADGFYDAVTSSRTLRVPIVTD